MNIPEGYKLVPVKANCDQLHAGASKSGVLFIYEAMVEAAPAVELNAYDEAKERELFEASYIEEFEANVKGASLSKSEMESMRNGDGYGEKRAFLNGQWLGWKKCSKSRAGIQS